MNIKEILNKAFNLGQTYWQQADSEYVSQNKKADLTLSKFQELSLAVEIDVNQVKLQMDALIEALEAAKSKIECSQRAHERASVVLVDEALEIIDTAIAQAKGA